MFCEGRVEDAYNPNRLSSFTAYTRIKVDNLGAEKSFLGRGPTYKRGLAKERKNLGRIWKEKIAAPFKPTQQAIWSCGTVELSYCEYK